ncbi:MAG TPA: ABC transporter permease [Bryobacteraceae bacterium]|jgi:predicted permease
MTFLTEWINRLRHFGRRKPFDSDLDEELRFHLEGRAEELMRSGLTAADASSQARREFGPMARAAEDSRAAWRFRWIEDVLGDARYALRSFRRSPAFTITAVLSLALGIGANAAIFNAIYTVLFKPLPVADPARLVELTISRPDRPGAGEVPPLAFVDELRRAGIFDGLSVMSADGLSFTYDDRAERILGEVVSADYFHLLGVRPILGQTFSDGVRTGHWAPEAVLSYTFWMRRFGGDPRVIGRTIHLNTYPFTIVGVSPAGFSGMSFGTDFELRIPVLPEGRELAQIAELGAQPGRRFSTLARLKPGTTIEQMEATADSQLQYFLRTTSLQRLREQGPRHIRLTAAGRGDNGALTQFHAPLDIIFVLVALVLLVACANVANMLFARGAARTREFAVRTSIGAGRLRLIRQLLVESLLLSMLAGCLAIAAGSWASSWLVRFLPQGHIALTVDLHMSPVALLFTFALAVLSTVLIGLAPAIEATRGNVAVTLKADSAAAIGGTAAAKFRRSLVVAQVTFSLVLLIAAGIFVRTMIDLRPSGYGPNPGRVLLFTMKPQREIYSEAQRRVLIDEIVRNTAQIPGVEAAGVAEFGPLGSRASSDSIEGDPGHTVQADTDWITAGFFEAAGIRMIAGRGFSPNDKPRTPFVAIVNESMARALYGSRNPIGRTLKFAGTKLPRPFEVIGVVRDVRYYDLHGEPQPAVWFTFQDYAAPYMPTLFVRAVDGETAGVSTAVRRELDALDKGFPVFNIKTLAGRVEDSLSRERMMGEISESIGLLALVLAAVGLYGLLAYSVARRTREIGIRMALGSNVASVFWMVAREALVLVGAGGVVGIACSIAAYRLLSHQLAGVSPISPALVAGSALVMLLVAAAALTIPALRACRVDPLSALHQE